MKFREEIPRGRDRVRTPNAHWSRKMQKSEIIRKCGNAFDVDGCVFVIFYVRFNIFSFTNFLVIERNNEHQRLHKF
jgi:hypothetical protein